MNLRLSRGRGESQIFVGAAAAILTLGLASWWGGAGRIVEERRAEIGEALATVLETTHQAIRSWATEHRAAAQVWAASPDVLRLTQKLLATVRTPEALRQSPAQGELRRWLRPVLQAKKYEGFFIIAPDESSLGSTRDSNTGTPNLLVRERKHELGRLWRGETVLTSPQISDVALPDSEGSLREDQPTMFVGAPIRDRTGAVIAALTFRLDPGRDFTAILQRGRIGASGETYAFDPDGRLISESRFDHQLRSIGLLGPDERGILRIQLRDPGERLLRGGASGRPSSSTWDVVPQPSSPTRSARSARRGALRGAGLRAQPERWHAASSGRFVSSKSYQTRAPTRCQATSPYSAGSSPLPTTRYSRITSSSCLS